jgi:hypothetical protein
MFYVRLGEHQKNLQGEPLAFFIYNNIYFYKDVSFEWNMIIFTSFEPDNIQLIIMDGYFCFFIF